jgi:hypothetical protein
MAGYETNFCFRSGSMLNGKLRLLLSAGVAVVVALTAITARADIIGTYVDATTSNTGPSSAFSATELDNDNLWHLDTSRDYARGGNVFVTQSSDETAPAITTTVSGLANGVYDVYAVFWTHTAQAWGFDASLVGGPVVPCTQYTGTPTGVATSDKIEQYMLLGQADVTDGSFAVSVVERDGYSRSWYDGLSFAAQEVPEPSTISLVVIGLFGLLAYAWRKRK